MAFYKQFWGQNEKIWGQIRGQNSEKILRKFSDFQYHKQKNMSSVFMAVN